MAGRPQARRGTLAMGRAGKRRGGSPSGYVYRRTTPDAFACDARGETMCGRTRSFTPETRGHRQLPLLVLAEEYVQVCVAVDAARPLMSNDVLGGVIDLLIRRGVPDYIRLDDDAKLRRKTPGVWLAEVDARTLFTERERLWSFGAPDRSSVRCATGCPLLRSAGYSIGPALSGSTSSKLPASSGTLRMI